MRTGSRQRRAVDLGTGLMLLAALALLVGDRLGPAWRSARAVEVGGLLPAGLRVRSLAAGDTLSVAGAGPTLLLFFRSDCPACARNLGAWRTLLARAGHRVRPLAAGLERPSPALAWVRERLPRALAVRPLEPSDFLARLAVRRVPATLLVGPGDRLLFRRDGVLAPADLDSLLVLAGPGLSSRGDGR